MAAIFSRKIIFVFLIALAVLFGILATVNNPGFLEDIWSQLFWLVTSTLATTFILETILQQDTDARRRREDAFAFRTFVANMLHGLLEMSASDQDLSQELHQAALFDKARFREVAEKASQTIQAAPTVQGEPYSKHYISMESGLRSLSENYIRLFANSREEMLQTYQTLQSLASRWVFRYELTDSFIANTAKEPDLTYRQQRQQETDEEAAEAKIVINETAVLLAELARRAAEYRGMPPPP